MKAWQVLALGEPIDVMRFSEIDEPRPGSRHISVRVLAAAANFPDALMCRGTYQRA